MSVHAETADCCGVRVMACGPQSGDCCTTFPRRFKTAKERQAALEHYRDELKSELLGVEERIQELDKK